MRATELSHLTQTHTGRGINREITMLGEICFCFFFNHISTPLVPLEQGSPKLFKEPVYCPSEFRGAALWQVRVENVPSPASMRININSGLVVSYILSVVIIRISGRKSAP